MNQIGQTNYGIGVMFKSLLSISMMRCRFLMCQHIGLLRTPGNNCIYSLCRKFICNDLNSRGVNRSVFYFNMASKYSGVRSTSCPHEQLDQVVLPVKVIIWSRARDFTCVECHLYNLKAAVIFISKSKSH